MIRIKMVEQGKVRSGVKIGYDLADTADFGRCRHVESGDIFSDLRRFFIATFRTVVSLDGKSRFAPRSFVSVCGRTD